MSSRELTVRIPGRWPLLGAALLLLSAVPARADKPRLDPELTFEAGLTHLREGRPQQALEALRDAAKADPKNPYFQHGLGSACMQVQRFEEAARAFRKALELNPNYAVARSDLGVALALQGKREEGRQELMAAFNNPFNGSSWNTARSLAFLAFEDKKYPEALNWYRTAIDRNPVYVDGYLGAADTLLAMGRGEEAIATLEGGLKAVSDDPCLLASLGEALYRAGRFGDARSKLDAAIAKGGSGVCGRKAGELLKNFPAK